MSKNLTPTAAFKLNHLVEQKYAEDQEFQNRLSRRKDTFAGPNDFIIVDNQKTWLAQFADKPDQSMTFDAMVMRYNKKATGKWEWDGEAKTQKVTVDLKGGQPVHLHPL
eukprot:7391441-Prymnesium_polylepis.1